MSLPSETESIPASPDTDSGARPAAPEVPETEPSDAMVEFRAYRAPREHGEAFVQPRFEDAPELIRRNRTLGRSYGAPISDLRDRARATLIENAAEYTGVYRDVSWVEERKSAAIIMAGHQPALFHPGVWFKNFALSELASRTGALAINLVVDNDVAASCSIRVPVIDDDTHRARYTSIPYDIGGGGVPYEQTTINDRETFDRFDRRVADAIRPIVPDPCVDRLWKHAKEAVQRCGVAGCALAQARHGLEGELGLRTLEIPLGVVCRGAPFAEFTLAILSELPRFHRCYNDAANHYRAAHGIRSTAHPVPNLAEEGDWFEAPLWIYGNDSPTRRAAWVRLSNDQLIITDRGQKEVRIDIQHPKLAAEQLAAAASPNFKLRPRALLTTMYARLVLSDLFLHGIGGAKYDQLGDMIMRSFFQVTAPELMVISATVKLPGIDSVVHADEVRQLHRQIRDTRFQGERFADRVRLDRDLVEEKQLLLDQPPPRGDRKAWHDRLVAINDSLSRDLRDLRLEFRQELLRQERESTSAAILSSREHPFCLFPLGYLTDTFGGLG